ncbi:MAG: hypothetical protein KF763_19925 [Cyclobacteriaceae bacterium]|nr:hypothetical protein [Cyclobacteriaceae bacterium]
MTENNSKLWITILVFSFVILWIIKIGYDDFRLSNDQRFTIGSTLGWKRTGKGPVIAYRFSVNNKSYENNASAGKDTVDVDSGRYFVRFLPSDPTVSRVMWDSPVPACIGEPPPNGWADIPSCE